MLEIFHAVSINDEANTKDNSSGAQLDKAIAYSVRVPDKRDKILPRDNFIINLATKVSYKGRSRMYSREGMV